MTPAELRTLLAAVAEGRIATDDAHARVLAELRASGQRCSRRRVARVLRRAGVRGVHGQRRRVRTTVPDRAATPAPDRVERLIISVHIHGLASRAAGVCMIRPTTSPAGRAAVLLN